LDSFPYFQGNSLWGVVAFATITAVNQPNGMQKPRKRVKTGPNHTNYAEKSREGPRGLAKSGIMTLPGVRQLRKWVAWGGIRDSPYGE